MNEHVELQRKINEAATAQIPTYAWDCTVPIVITHQSAVHHFGTGTLFRVADYFFLVTAGHVIKQACANGKTLGIGGANDGRFIAMTGDALVSSECQYGTSADPFDIGLLQLSKSAVDRLSNKRFLLFDDVEFEDQPRTAVYTIFGFPAIWSSPSVSHHEKVVYRALQYTTYRYDGDTSALQEYQERLHLLLNAQLHQANNEDATPAEFVDADHQTIPFPGGLRGISGCSVWRIGDLDVPIDEWNVDRSRLVAVQTGVYHRKRAIKATRWAAVSTMIHEAFPELRPAMELWRVR